MTMATNPTRLQQQARDQLGEALFLISSAYRLDGRSPVDREGFAKIVRGVVAVSSAFEADQIVALAIDRRARGLNLSASAVELIMLVERETQPWEALMLSDEAFLKLVKSLEEELGMD
jgi:hypothetical protein